MHNKRINYTLKAVAHNLPIRYWKYMAWMIGTPSNNPKKPCRVVLCF